MIYPRDLLNDIKPFLKRKEFIAIVGPRQSGKTTFLEIIKKHLQESMKIKHDAIKIITFEDRRLLLQFESDPIALVESYLSEKHTQKTYLLIDEFQYAHNGGQHLKLIYDTMKNIKIIITGSSSLDIKAKVGKFMVGRILSFYLYPFSFGEYLAAANSRLAKIYKRHNHQCIQWLIKGTPFLNTSKEDVFYNEFIKPFENYCIWGGYPSVVLSTNVNERKKILSDIYDNYVLKDIKSLLELATERNLYLLSQYLSTQIGNIVVYQTLSETSRLDYRNLIKHLNILRETFVCQEVRPFFKNRQKELSKNPKIFFYDMGFRNNLIENMNTLDKHTDKGAIVENFAFIRLIKLFGQLEKINFWRTKAGAEVDFIIHTEGKIIPIEIKYSLFTSEKISKSLVSFIESFNPERALVLTKNYWGSTKRNNTKILFVPIYYF